MKEPRYYKLDGNNNVVAVPDVMQWAFWFEKNQKRRIVRQTHIGPYFVSTVFLGLDHRWIGEGPPIVFETMVFVDSDEDLNHDCSRHCTWDEALAAHEDTIKKVKVKLQ